MASADRPSGVPDGPHTTKAALVCKACHEEFDSTSLIGGTHEAWVGWMESQRCPKCGTLYRLEHARPRQPEEYLHPSAIPQKKPAHKA